MNINIISFPRKFQMVCILLFLLLMGGCSEPSRPTVTSQPAASTVAAQSTASPTVSETLSVAIGQVQPDLGPKVVEQTPLAGERLSLQPVITIGFDRDMDHNKTGGSLYLFRAGWQEGTGQSHLE